MQRRADFSIQLVFKDGNNNAINITGYTVLAQCWDEGRNIKYADFTVTYTNRVTGTVDLSLLMNKLQHLKLINFIMMLCL